MFLWIRPGSRLNDFCCYQKQSLVYLDPSHRWEGEKIHNCWRRFEHFGGFYAAVLWLSEYVSEAMWEKETCMKYFCYICFAGTVMEVHSSSHSMTFCPIFHSLSKPLDQSQIYARSAGINSYVWTLQTCCKLDFVPGLICRWFCKYSQSEHRYVSEVCPYVPI